VTAMCLGFQLFEGGVLASIPAEGPQANCHGLVRSKPPAPHEPHQLDFMGIVHAQLIYLVSGDVAQRLAAPRSRRGSYVDDASAARLLAAAYETERGRAAALQLAREEAQSLLRRVWPRVVAVAELFLSVPGLVPAADIRAAALACRTGETPSVAPRARRPSRQKAPRRADAAAAALLVLTKLASDQPDLTVQLTADMARALEFVALSRDLEPQALQAKWDRVVDQESARRAWRPVGQR
jgi:hypothetical protein